MQRIESKEKVAIITAAGRRIGAATARLLHEKGMNIVIHYHSSKADAEALATELNAKRADSAIVVACNLETEVKEFHAKIIQPALDKWGRVDVLVNNASQYFETPMGEVTVEQFDKLFNTNVRAPFFLAQAAAPYLKAHKGDIVCITDATKGYANYEVYSASKAALKNLVMQLANAFSPLIRVNGVAPGVTGLPEGDNELSQQQREKILSEIPLREIGTFEDVARAVLSLVDGSLAYSDGQIINVDGGKSRHTTPLGKSKSWAERQALAGRRYDVFHHDVFHGEVVSYEPPQNK